MRAESEQTLSRLSSFTQQGIQEVAMFTNKEADPGSQADASKEPRYCIIRSWRRVC